MIKKAAGAACGFLLIVSFIGSAGDAAPAYGAEVRKADEDL